VLIIVFVVLVAIGIGGGVAWSRRHQSVDQVRGAIHHLAHALHWRLTGEHGDIGAVHPSGEVVLLPAPREDDPGGVTLVLVGRRAEIALSVWPRDPDTSTAERWGPEVETGDPIFDTRFVVHSRAPQSLVLAFLIPSIRKALFDLGEPALLADPHRVALLFCELPDPLLLDRAVAVTRTIAAGCGRIEPGPTSAYR